MTNGVLGIGRLPPHVGENSRIISYFFKCPLFCYMPCRPDSAHKLCIIVASPNPFQTQLLENGWNICPRFEIFWKWWKRLAVNSVWIRWVIFTTWIKRSKEKTYRRQFPLCRLGHQEDTWMKKRNGQWTMESTQLSNWSKGRRMGKVSKKLNVWLFWRFLENIKSLWLVSSFQENMNKNMNKIVFEHFGYSEVFLLVQLHHAGEGELQPGARNKLVLKLFAFIKLCNTLWFIFLKGFKLFWEKN